MISVVIPTRDDPEGAYLTAGAAYTQLERYGQQFEIIFVVDSGPTNDHKDPGEFSNASTVYVRHGSPQGARHEGIMRARGSKVFCLDSHVVLSQGFFEDALEVMNKAVGIPTAMVFAPLVFRNRRSPAYGYAVNWGLDFWNGGYHNQPKHKDTAYSIACAGHGAFLVDREAYVHTGGYTLEQKGWGGEETFLCLKFWMLGYQCAILPQHYQWHYMKPGRNSATNTTEEFAMNFCIAAYAIGGLPACQPIFEWFGRRHSRLRDRWHEITQRSQTERAKILNGPYKGNLEALRAHFKREGIPH